MLISGNTNITKVYCSGFTISKIYSCGGELIWEDSPTPPTPTFNGKFKAEYVGGTSFSADCDSDSVLRTGTTRQGGYSAYTAMTNAVIGDCITSIGNSVFENCYSLTSITIPNSITSIGDAAFEQCITLTSVAIPSGVTTINSFTFRGCSNLTSIAILDSVTSVGQAAFKDCSNLTSIHIPSGVTYIETECFRGCSSLTNIDIPSGVTNIKNNAFSGCSSLTSVTINATTPPTLVSGAFDNTNNCPIYVPSESVEIYKAASEWYVLRNRIQAIPNS